MMKKVESAPVRPSSRVEARACGRLATMPAKMISEMPLPTPRAVICSPSHIRNTVPPTRVTTVTSRKNRPGFEHRRFSPGAHALEPDRDAVGLDRRQQHRAVAGILVELLAPALALLLQRLERGRHRGQELDDDRGRDVRHDVQREDRHAPERAAREHVEHAEDAAGIAREDVVQDRRVDAGDRDVGAEPVDHQRAQREPDAALELGRLGEGREIDAGGELFGG